MYISLVKETSVILYLIVCVICDIRTFKIPNFIHSIFLVIRLIILISEGICAIAPAFIGIILPVAVLFPVFLLRAIGAGDIKMCSVVCFFYGYDILWHILWYTLILGSLMSVFKIFSIVFIKGERSNYFRLVDFLDIGNLPEFHKIHLGIAIAVASIYVLYDTGLLDWRR